MFSSRAHKRTETQQARQAAAGEMASVTLAALERKTNIHLLIPLSGSVVVTGPETKPTVTKVHSQRN